MVDSLANLRYRINARTFDYMLRIYCSSHHRSTSLCEECNSILEYTLERNRKCPFGAMKPVCSKCEIHCFKKSMAQNVREVMAFSGPRMIFRHPFLALHHIFERMAIRRTRLKKRSSK